MASPPQTLPADFFSKQEGATAPDTLPADFFAARDPEAVKRSGILSPGGRSTQPNAGQRVLNYATDTLSNIPGSGIKLLGNAASALIHPVDTAANIGKVIAGTVQNMTPGYVTPKRPGYSAEANAAGQALKQRYGSPSAIAETIRTDPVGAAADAATVAGGVSGLARGTAAAASSLPRVASTANRVADVAGAVSDAVNPLTVPLKVAGAIPKAVGKGFMRSALGLGGRTERYGATPATAALEETSGITPKAVQESAGRRLGELDTQLDALVSNATKQGNLADLTAARKVVDIRIKEIEAANGDPSHLYELRKQLTEPVPGFAGKTEYPTGAQQPVSFQQNPSAVLGPNGQPFQGPPVAVPGAPPQPVVSAKQPPLNYLEMKRRIGKDFTKFDAAIPLKNETRQIGNQVYGEMASELNQRAPGARPINQRMQSLIPVEQAAQRTDESAGTVTRAVNRATRPTGALAATLFGFHEGGALGGLGAMTLQEALASPTVRIALARALYGTGKGLSSPVARRALTTLGVEGEAGSPDARFNLRPSTPPAGIAGGGNIQ